MYRTVIVPLDGSPFAAQAVATAAEIAQRSGAVLVLTRVHEAYRYEETEYSISEDLSRRDQEQYLADVMEYVQARYRLQAERRLLTGAIVPALCTFAQELDDPLIVISTHGRTGFSRFWLGSVADAVARHAATPVLMLRHHGTENSLAPPHAFRGIVVPLDGSDLSETALPHAVALAAAFRSRLVLVHVVGPTPVPVSAYTAPFATSGEFTPDSLSTRMEAAQRYVSNIAARVSARNAGVEATASVRVSDSPGPAVLETAEWESADTIALATHGRGASRLIAPSVADKILRAGPEAVLIVRAPDAP